MQIVQIASLAFCFLAATHRILRREIVDTQPTQSSYYFVILLNLKFLTKKSIWYFAFHLKSSVVLSSESDSLGTDICHWYGVTIHLVWHCGGPGYNYPCWLCGLWSYFTAICTLIGEKLILPIPLNILHWNTSLFVFHIKPRDSQTLLEIVKNKKFQLK